VSLSTTNGGSLEVQTVTTSVDNIFPVYTIQTTATSTLSGHFTVQIGACTSGSIYVDAVSKAMFESTDSSTPGERDKESVESVLNAMQCLQDLGVTVEVFRDIAGLGQANVYDGTLADSNIGTSTNSDQDADAQGGHIWRVAFLNAETATFPGMSLASDANVGGASKNVRVEETTPGNYMAGGFKLALGNFYYSTTIPFDATERQFADALESMESVAAVKVTRSINDVKLGSYVWSVTFLAMGEQFAGGDVPELSVYENSLDDSSLVYPNLSCDIAVATVVDGAGKPAVWQFQTLVQEEKNPVHVIQLQGTGIMGSFTYTIAGYGTTGDIYYDTVASVSDEVDYVVYDAEHDDGGGSFHGTRLGESIESLVAALPNWDSSTMSVVASKTVTDVGGVDHVEWRITYIGVDYTLPEPTINANTAAATSSFSLGYVSYTTDRSLAGNGVAGTFQIDYFEDGVRDAGVVVNTGDMSVSASEADMKAYLTGMLNSINPDADSVELEVSRAGPDLHNGYKWTVALLRSAPMFYTSAANSGSAGVFAVNDGRGITGVGATAKATLLRSGGEGAAFHLTTRYVHPTFSSPPPPPPNRSPPPPPPPLPNRAVPSAASTSPRASAAALLGAAAPPPSR
jgi:hypothetical protein